MKLEGVAQDVTMAQCIEDTQSLLRYPVHIEVRQKTRSRTRPDTLRGLVYKLISDDEHLVIPSVIVGWETNDILRENVDRIAACESTCPMNRLPLDQAVLSIHVYQPSTANVFEEFSSGAEGEEVVAATVSELPCIQWEGLWDSLIYPDDIKAKLLNYIYATTRFSDANVDFNIVSWNRVVLLHGPPGTGKTSLSRALAQKLSIRLSHRYAATKILEINSHSLFSRWFSESGKLVQRLFSSVNELIDDEDTFVVVLIDEVESLTAARSAVVAGTEPSDALRVVNALLTQLDKLKHRKNVLVMATSNLSEAIDSAFLDRADIIQYVGLPPTHAIYEILRTCLQELITKNVVLPADVPDYTQVDAWAMGGGSGRMVEIGLRLLNLAEKSKGMSGRALRRLPVLAHARLITSGLLTPPSTVPGIGNTNGVEIAEGKKMKAYLEISPVGANTMDNYTYAAEQWLTAMENVIGQDRAVGSRT